MNFNQFLLENDSVVGKRVWITDFRRGKSGGYVRHVPPMLVEVVSNTELPKNKRVYYSNVHFRKIKNGKVSKEVHAPYDNTGYRSYTGISVNIFYKYEEAVKHYNEQINEIVKSYNEDILNLLKEIEDVTSKKIGIKEEF